MWFRASLVAQAVKNLPAMQETWFQSLDREGPLEEKMATHSGILAWESPWLEEPGGLQSMRSQRVRHDWATELNWTEPGTEPTPSAVKAQILLFLLLIGLFLAVRSLYCCSWAFSSCGARASHCGGFSCCGTQAPGHRGFSRGGAQA